MESDKLLKLHFDFDPKSLPRKVDHKSFYMGRCCSALFKVTENGGGARYLSTGTYRGAINSLQSFSSVLLRSKIDIARITAVTVSLAGSNTVGYTFVPVSTLWDIISRAADEYAELRQYERKLRRIVSLKYTYSGDERITGYVLWNGNNASVNAAMFSEVYNAGSITEMVEKIKRLLNEPDGPPSIVIQGGGAPIDTVPLELIPLITDTWESLINLSLTNKSYNRLIKKNMTYLARVMANRKYKIIANEKPKDWVSFLLGADYNYYLKDESTGEPSFITDYYASSIDYNANKRLIVIRDLLKSGILGKDYNPNKFTAILRYNAFWGENVPYHEVPVVLLPYITSRESISVSGISGIYDVDDRAFVFKEKKEQKKKAEYQKFVDLILDSYSGMPFDS